MPTDKSLNGYDFTARNIADKIAKRLVERALDTDRKKLVRKIQRKSKVPKNSTPKIDKEGQIVTDNYVDVAVNRVFDEIVNEMITQVTADFSNSVKYSCSGNIELVTKGGVEETVDRLQQEMANFVDEFADKNVDPTFGGLFRGKDFQMTDEDYFVNPDCAEFEEFLGGESRYILPSSSNYFLVWLINLIHSKITTFFNIQRIYKSDVSNIFSSACPLNLKNHRVDKILFFLKMARKPTRVFSKLRRVDPTSTEEAEIDSTGAEEMSGRRKEGHRTESTKQDRDSGQQSQEESLPLQVHRLSGEEKEGGKTRTGRAD
jgi:hypothetical protein